MKLMQRLTLLVMITALIGCAAMDRKMSAWEGQSRSDLIAHWGPPQEILDDGDGGEIFIYIITDSYTQPGYSSTYASGTTTTNTRGSAYSAGNSTYGSADSTASGSVTGHTTYTPPKTTIYENRRMFWVGRDQKVHRWAWKGL